MRTFNLEEFKINPYQKLVIEHYSGNGEIWPVEQYELIMDGECLIIKSPLLGHSTDNYILLQGKRIDIRETHGNLIGYLKFDNDLLMFNNVIQMIYDMKEDDTLYFKDPEEQYGWGVNIFSRFGTIIYIFCHLDDVCIEFYEASCDYQASDDFKNWIISFTKIPEHAKVLFSNKDEL